MKDISIIISSKTCGGHEIQAIKLANSLSEYCLVKLFTNSISIKDQRVSDKVNIKILNLNTCANGNLINQIFYSNKISRNKSLLKEIIKSKHIIISAGAIEASIAFLISILRIKKDNKIILYLPFFFDRTLIWPFPLGNIYNKFLKIILNKFNAVLTINDLNKQIIDEKVKIPVKLISNKITNKKLKYPLKITKPRLVFIGRIAPQKRIVQLIIWCNNKKIPIDELLIIGDGPQMNLVKKLSKNMLNIKITFTGWLTHSEQAKILRKNDILIINSIIEGDPLVVSESLVKGIKCISRRIRSLQYILHKDYLFDSQNDLIKVIERTIKEKPEVFVKKNKYIQKNRNVQIKEFVDFLNKI